MSSDDHDDHDHDESIIGCANPPLLILSSDDHDDQNESIFWCADPPPWKNDDGTDELRRLEDWAKWERSFENHETYSQSR